MKTLKIFTAALLFVGLTANAYAQNPATENISATANVMSALSVVGERNLQFGDVVQNTAKSIERTDADNSGYFTIAVPGNASISFGFSALPTVLAGTGDAVSHDLPISFETIDAGWIKGANNPAGAAAFNPNGGSTAVTQTAENGDVFHVYIGGTVTPDATQVVGTYEGVITLSAEIN